MSRRSAGGTRSIRGASTTSRPPSNGPGTFRGLALGRKPAGLDEYAGYYSKVYAAAATVTGATAVVDSSKHSALAYCLRHAPGIDLRVVHVVRDSRGVAYSWTKKVMRPEAETDEQMTRYSPSRSALLWNAHNASFGLLGRLGVPVLRVRYEELLADPMATLRELARFAELPEAAQELSFLRATDDGYVADLGPSHSAAGNPMRFTIGTVPLRRDEAWRRSLPEGPAPVGGRAHRAAAVRVRVPAFGGRT